ncbi:MAG: gamma-glutamyltransferase [Deltaproteobacteria bacterium]|nr:gamma-glutamyltransferase [Deltaproteobacteria bacterium]MBW2419420.1 gamma-glutamyltransferase [Deltaproteobacteria bacterium]
MADAETAGRRGHEHGVVAAGHTSVCDAACRILRSSGNAFDAVVAAGFASAVCEPALTSLGGGGFLLARTAAGHATLFDFFADTPGRAAPGQALPADALEPHFLPVTVHFPGGDQVFNTGLGSAAVPGTLMGLLHVHERLGRLPLAEVLAPAIELARKGVPLNYHQAYFLSLLEPIMTLTTPARALYAPGGSLLAEGEDLTNPELAAFLETLPQDGARELYAGGLARHVARDMAEGQGLLTEADLAAYQVRERRPLEARYRGHLLLTNPPPAFGGRLLALALELLEGHSWPADLPASPQHGGALFDVSREVDTRREEHLAAGPRFGRGTTHVSVCDAEGNAASMTNSNGEGSGYLVPGTGIMLNNMLGEDDLHPDGFHASPPGQRVASMMSPSILLAGDAVRMVLGSGGSKRIRSALLHTISLVVDFDLALREAVEHPRLHWDGARAQLEPGFSSSLLERLGAEAKINEWPCRDVYFGGVNAVTPGGEAAGDPRRGGQGMHC